MYICQGHQGITTSLDWQEWGNRQRGHGTIGLEWINQTPKEVGATVFHASFFEPANVLQTSQHHLPKQHHVGCCEPERAVLAAATGGEQPDDNRGLRGAWLQMVIIKVPPPPPPPMHHTWIIREGGACSACGVPEKPSAMPP